MVQKKCFIMFKNNIYSTIMKNGKKHISEKILLKVFKSLQKTQKNSQSVLKLSVLNSSPVIFLKQVKRKRKQTKEFPFLLKPQLRTSYGLKNLIKVCRKENSAFYKNLRLELINSAKKSGKSVGYRSEIHQSAFSKKKFANYRWF